MPAVPRTASPASAIARRARGVLLAALPTLGLLYLIWFRHDAQWLAALVVFVLPPLALALGVWLRRARATFWTGVAALGWFAHAVMAVWVQPEVRALAWAVIGLSVLIVVAASLPGLHARFARRRV